MTDPALIFPALDFASATFADAPAGKRRLLRVQIFPVSDAPLTHPSGELRFDRAFAERVIANFRSYPGKVPSDYDHGSEKGAAGPDVGIASGWVERVELEPGGVFAYVDPTARAVGLVEAGEYRFASPTVHFDWTDPRTGKPQGPTLLSVALTNRPFIRGMAPIESVTLRDAGASPPRKAAPMPDETPPQPAPETIALADHTAQVQQLRDEIATLADRTTKAEAEATKLRDEKLERDAIADVEAGERAGKIVPATRAKMLELRKASPALFADLLAASPALVKFGSPVGADAPSAPPTQTRDEKGDALVKLADSIAVERKVGYATALRLAREEHPELAEGF